METAPEFYTLLWLAGDQGAYADPSELDPGMVLRAAIQTTRSEERRVGKECRSRWSPYH